MSKEAFIIALFLAGILVEAFSQSKRDYSSYQKEEIFSEHFQDNQKGWIRFYSKIKKGRYIVETIGNDEPAISTIPVQIDSGRDFEIETEVALEWNRSKELAGIVWNYGINNGYYFGFNKENKVQVFKKENDDTTLLDENNSNYPEFETFTNYLIPLEK